MNESEKKSQSVSRVQLCNPMDCSPPGSSVPGILQARKLGQVDIPFSWDLCSPVMELISTASLVLQWLLHHYATREESKYNTDGKIQVGRSCSGSSVGFNGEKEPENKMFQNHCFNVRK